MKLCYNKNINLNFLNKKSYDDSLYYYQKKSQPISGPERIWIKRSLLGLDNNAKILEIGSGLGERSDLIESFGYRVQRSDFSESFINYLKENGKDVLDLDLLTDPLPQSDMIFASAVLLHFKRNDLGSIFFKINNALNNNGRFVFSLKGGSGQEVVSQSGMGERFFSYYRVDELISLLDSNRFRVYDLTVSGSKPTWIQITAIKHS